MTENEVTNTTTGTVIEPEKVPKEEETEAPQTSTSQDINDDSIEEDIEDIEEGVLEKLPSLPILKWNSRYFAFGTSESKVSSENLRQYYKKIRKTIKVPSESRENPVEDKATTSAATEVAGEVIQTKSDDHNPLLHCLSTNIAHATQTGKGLLFYYKSKDHAKEPLGVINLKFVKEVKDSSSGGKVYEFKIITEDREYLLKADSESTRKRWINTITTRAKESKEFPVPETEEYQNIYNQVYHDRFLKDSGVTSDSEGCTSGEDNEIKNNRRKTFAGFFKKPEKVEKTETTTTTEVTETVEEEGSDPAAVVVATTVDTTIETTEEVKTGERKPGLFHFFFGGKNEKEKVEVKESTEEVVEAENSNAAETKVEEAEKTIEEDSKVVQKRRGSMIPSFFRKSKETTTVATASSTNTETVAVEKTEETVETTVEKTETSPTTSPKSIFNIFRGKKDDSHVEPKVVETAEQTEVTDTVVEETAQTVAKATEEVVEEVAVKTTTEEVVEDVKSEGSSPKKLFRKITKVFNRETKEAKIEETEEVAETTEEITETTEKVEEEGIAGSSTEVKKEETVEVKKEDEKKEIIEEKKEKHSFLRRLSKQTQPLQPEEVKPETQPTTEDAIKSATEATDNESECVVLKKIKDPRHHGPLNKLTKRIVGEKSDPRYFVFTQEGSLAYYKSEKDESEPKKIEINHDVTITKTGETVFQIETKSKTYKLSATSEEKRDEWVNLLEEYKKSLPVTSPDVQSSSSKVQDDAEKTEEITEEKAKEITEGETEEKTKEITEVIIEEKTEEITKVIIEEKTEEETEVKVVKEETEVKIEERIEEQTEVKTEGESVEKKTEETIVETSTTVDETK